MPNTFLTVQDIARQALLRLRNNIVMASLVHRDFSNDFQKKGDTILVKRPNTFEADEFTTTISEQAITEGSVQVKLDKIADVSVPITSKELTLNINDFTEQITAPAMEALAQKIDADIMGLYIDIPYFVGAAGTTPDGLDDFANARKILNINKVPLMMRSGVWDPTADSKFSILDAIVNADKSGSTQALREGAIGRVQGLNNYMSQNIKTHTAGGYTALADVTATGASGASTVAFESAAGVSVATLLKGDVFTLDGYQYVVTANTVAAVAGDIAAVAIYPALKTTVAADAVVFADVTARAHVANLAFHKNAFAFVNRPQALPQGGATGYIANFEGLSIRVTMGYDMSTKTNTMSFDILYGVKTLQQELGVRILG